MVRQTGDVQRGQLGLNQRTGVVQEILGHLGVVVVHPAQGNLLFQVGDLADGMQLGGAAGVLIALYYNSLEPLMGVTPGLKSFVAAVLGGIGIIPGAALGGFVIGLLETFATAFGMSDFRDAIVYGILLLILIVRPAGILGKNVKEKV